MKAILVIDDLESVRFYHQQLLERVGFRVFAANDGVEGLKLLEGNAVDLVVLDLLMPRMTGEEFLGRARALPRYSGLPVLVISSEAKKESADGQFTPPCAVLRKPILPGPLLAAVRELIA